MISIGRILAHLSVGFGMIPVALGLFPDNTWAAIGLWSAVTGLTTLHFLPRDQEM